MTESIDTYNKVCDALAPGGRSRVISVEYRLAPEHRFLRGWMIVTLLPGSCLSGRKALALTWVG